MDKVIESAIFLVENLDQEVSKGSNPNDVSEYSLYHQALIKVLVEEELKKKKQT